MNWTNQHRAYFATHHGQRYKVIPHGRFWTARKVRYTVGAFSATLPEYIGTFRTAAEAKAACEARACV